MEAGPPIVFCRVDDSGLHRVGMNVIDLLPNHPTAPQRHCLETFLPDLSAESHAYRLASGENTFCSKALESADEFLDATVARIADQVKVIGH